MRVFRIGRQLAGHLEITFEEEQIRLHLLPRRYWHLGQSIFDENDPSMIVHLYLPHKISSHF